MQQGVDRVDVRCHTNCKIHGQIGRLLGLEREGDLDVSLAEHLETFRVG